MAKVAVPPVGSSVAVAADPQQAIFMNPFVLNWRRCLLVVHITRGGPDDGVGTGVAVGAGAAALLQGGSAHAYPAKAPAESQSVCGSRSGLVARA